MPLKVVRTQPTPLLGTFLEKAKERRAEKELLRTVIFGRKVSARRVPSAPANVMMLKTEPPVADSPPPPLLGVETKQEEEEGTVVVPLVPHAVPGPQVAGQSSVEGLVDPPKGLVLDVRITKSVGSTLALEATREQKVARAKDIFKTSVTRGGVYSDIRPLPISL